MSVKPDYEAFSIAVVNLDPMGLDGSDIQDLAVKHSVLVQSHMVVPCGEICECAEYADAGETVLCFRKNFKTEVDQI